MTKRFKIYDKETFDTYIEDTKDCYSDGTPKSYWFEENEDFCALFDLLNKLNDENEQLKQLLDEAEDIILCQCTPHYQRQWENIKKNLKR